MSFLKKSRFTVDMPLQHEGEAFSALYQTITDAFVLLPERAWSYALTDPVASSDPGTMDLLHEQGFLVEEDADEVSLYETWRQQYVHDFSTIRSKVLVTRKCNNGCRYCILDAEPGEMTPETARAMDRFYVDFIREKNPVRVEDDYLGGEPLLNPGIILESAARRFYYCLGKGIGYDFSITTNGTLINERIISGMKEVGLSGIRVSLAGPGPVHDRLRPSRNNGNTYGRIMENLQAVSGLAPVSIECQYDSGALDFLSIPEMLDDLSERGIKVRDVAFTPILKRRGESLHNGGMGDPRIPLFLKREAGRRGFPVNEEAPSNRCMADFRARFVFDTDGSIIPCPSLQGGEMAYGHVGRGIDFVSETRLRKRRLPERCLEECELLPICMGGCRLQALVHHNDFGGADCHYDTYRLFLEDYIREKASTAALPE